MPRCNYFQSCHNSQKQVQKAKRNFSDTLLNFEHGMENINIKVTN